MAILRAKEIEKMTREGMEEKLIELKKELIRANVAANRTNAKTKEIKRTISRLLTHKISKSKDLLKKK
ncbi:50S ribosomal protein L29 [Candidatus Pacearchaeota archaeon]|nr:50S ribosomal protein L29 [Candidatus Pacearchaeota archaeon]